MPYSDPDRRRSYARERQEQIAWRAKIEARAAATRRMLKRMPPWLAPLAIEPKGARLVRVMREENDE